MHLTISPADMQRIERTAFSAGVPSILLMEQAAQAVVCTLEDMLDGCDDRHVLFVAGCGNNGGDALAAARMFVKMGGEATVWLPLGCKTPDAQSNLSYLKNYRVLWCPALDPTKNNDAVHIYGMSVGIYVANNKNKVFLKVNKISKNASSRALLGDSVYTGTVVNPQKAHDYINVGNVWSRHMGKEGVQDSGFTSILFCDNSARIVKVAGISSTSGGHKNTLPWDENWDFK